MRRRPWAVALPLAVLLVSAVPALAAGGTVTQTQTTSSYTIRLEIGPLSTMLMPSQASTAKSGMVMVPMAGMAMPKMSMTQNGHAVNHHLEAYILDKTSGAAVTTYVPTITITDAAGASYTLADTVLMYDVTVGKSDMHFGNNVYMNGTYTVTVKVNGQTATFRNVTLGGGSLPTTGAHPATTWTGVVLLMLGGALALPRRRRRAA